MSDELTEFGRTWPLVRTPRIAVTISYTSEVMQQLISIEDQIVQTREGWAEEFAGYDDLEIKVEQVEALALSPEDKEERDRLAQEALEI